MARRIYDADGHTKNFCILSKAICVVLPKVICWEINRHITQFELEELLRRRLKLKLSEVEEHCNVIEHTTLSSLCNILQFYQNKPNLNNYSVPYDTSIVSPKDVNEILTLIQEMYLFEEKRMIPKREFKKLWRKLRNLCRTFDRRCLPKLMPYRQQCNHIQENFRYEEVHNICNLVKNCWEMEDECLKQDVIQLRCMQFSFLWILLQYIRGKAVKLTQFFNSIPLHLVKNLIRTRRSWMLRTILLNLFPFQTFGSYWYHFLN